MWPMGIMSALGGLGSAAGGIMGLFGNNDRNNPANAANQWLDKIPEAMRPYYQHYIDSGGKALGNLEGEYGNLTNDPQSVYDKLSKGYKPSEGYQFKLKQALGAGQNAAASGGMLGTPQDQQVQMQTATDLSSEDFEKYLNHMTNLYGTGLSGQEGINKQGFDASTSYGNALANIFGQKAQNDFAGQDWTNQNNKNNWQNIFGGIGAAGSGYASGNMMDDFFKKYMSGG